MAIHGPIHRGWLADERSPCRVVRRSIPALALSALLPTIACEGAASRDGGVSVVDSAGIQIVHSSRPLWDDGGAWELSEAPIVQIGAVQGDPDYELHRVAAVVRLSDGRIVVADAGSSQLRYFDASGTHIRSVGRAGDGPGEFQFLSRLWKLGADSVAAFDNAHVRVTVFDPQGSLVRSTPLAVDEASGRPSARTGFAEGSILTVSSTGSLSPQDGRIDGGTWTYSRYSADGSFLNEIGEGPGGARWGTDFRGRFTFPYLPLVLGIPPAGAGARSLILGEGTRAEMEVRETDGTLARLIRWDPPLRPVTAEVIDRYRRHLADPLDDPAAERQVELWVDKVPFPETMPVYQSVMVDALGNAWVEQYRPPWEDQARWWVFDREGRWLGEPPVPAGVRIEEIGPDYVLGVRRDDLGVERVVLFALTRDGS
jgi:hypothetical protein